MAGGAEAKVAEGTKGGGGEGRSEGGVGGLGVGFGEGGSYIYCPFVRRCVLLGDPPPS